jgi:methionine biosynthesis protein MetW
MSSATRPDYAAIARWVPDKARVLDLGCGSGELLRFLREERGATGYGIEIAANNIVACLANGVNVIQRDLESGLSGFEAGAFDCVILSQTLQAMHHTELMMREMLRVGREAIVTFPNFGYWRNRLQVLRGKMPVSRDLPYQWFDTPNVHLCTLADFEAFCGDLQVHILERLALDGGEPIRTLPNLRGSLAIYRVRSAA